MSNYPKHNRNQVQFPSIEDVANELLWLQGQIEVPEVDEDATEKEDGEDLSNPFDDGYWEESAWLDVRLQVYPSGSWAVRYGDSSYDLDHHGYWGSGSLSADGNCQELAYEMIEEAKDQEAMENAF